MRNPRYPQNVCKITEKTPKKVEKFQWKYRNIILLAISFVLAYHVLKNVHIVSFIESLGTFGYPASFIAGLFFTYGLTTVPATAAIYNLGQNLNPFLIAFIGAFGSVISDYLIFKFVRDKLSHEIIALSKAINRLRKPISSLILEEGLLVGSWRKISRSKILQTLLPIIAGFIIASPLPDELGVALFGAIKFNPKKFIFIAYLFNFVGILAIGLSSRIFS